MAAGVVLVHHALMTDPGLATAYTRPEAGESGWRQVLLYSPLHVFWGGTQAVFVFFVLSGFVLALPAAAGRPTAWVPYYPKRLLRLYLPVWAAVALALVGQVMVRRDVFVSGGWWLDGHHQVTGLSPVLDDLLLLGDPQATNTALWSLKWEVVFSLLLPLFVWGGQVLRRLPMVPVIVVLVAVPAALAGSSDAARYLPMFGAGVVLALGRDQVTTAAARLQAGAGRWDAARWGAARWGRAVPGLALVAALVGLNAYWTLFALWPATPILAVHLARVVEVLSATVLVALVVVWPPLQSVLGRPAVRWLGARSFSLYLVHEPIVVGVATLLGPVLVSRFGSGTVISVLVVEVSAVTVALAVAAGFYVWVEKPSLRWVNAVATKVRSVTGSRVGAAQLPSS
jgi:peptidoglycan/LPS O-acetylase OafA/YrhL